MNTKRINKKEARKLHEAGVPYIIAPCKVDLHSGVHQTIYGEALLLDFDNMVQWYTYYNCTNSRGKYPAYYQIESDNTE